MSGVWGSRTLVSVDRWSGRPVVRVLAAGVALVLAVTLADAAVLPERAVATPPQAPPKPQCPDQRPDAVSAAVTARLCNKDVEISGAVSETTRMWALRDGTTKAEVFAGPVRYRDGGVWKPVDLTMVRRPDGSVGPKGHPRGLTLAGGGAAGGGAAGGELVSLRHGEERIGFGWTAGALPRPRLSGPKATYVDAMPGVDVVIEATSTGYQQFVTVKDRAAAARVTALRMPVRATGLSVEAGADGTVVFRNRAGAVVGTSGAADMWDATVEPVSGEHVRRARLGVRVERAGAGGRGTDAGPDAAAGPELVVVPDAAFLADPRTQFPVTIDPAPTLYPTFDAFVQTGYTSDQSGSPELKLGTWNGGADKARSFIRWPTSGLAGTRIISANMYLWEHHSFSCRQAEWQVWLTNWADHTVRWTNQPGWATHHSSSWQTKGYSSSCDDGWVGVDVRSFFQAGADNRWGETTMGLRAQSETDNDQWKRFNSGNAGGNVPHVVLVYNTPPGAPADPSMSPAAPCTTTPGAAFVGSTTPELRVTAVDPDGDNVDVHFEWWAVGGSSMIGKAIVNAPAGTVAKTRVPAGAFVEGGRYFWRAAAFDGQDWAGIWSPTCEFTVDTQRPPVPFVSSPLYPSIATDNTWGHGGYGQAGQFSLRSAGEPAGAAGSWSFAEGSGTTAADAAGNGHTATLQGGAGWAASGALSLNGSTAHASTAGPVAATGGSFTVAAWVKASTLSGFRTAVSQDGSQGSGFYLQYEPNANVWAFSRLNADVANATATRAVSRSTPQVGAWTHLVGVYDAAAGQLHLYVNGVLESTVAYTGGWAAGGPVQIGRAKWNGAPVDYWPGEIDDVRVYNRAVAGTELTGLADVTAYQYQLDTDAAPTTVTATSTTTVTITPSEDGRRTLRVWAKDRAGNLSEPNTYQFNVGRAGLSLPRAGANVVKRTKLAIAGDSTYTRVTYQYRRGPGGVEQQVPLANLRKADGSPVSTYPVRLADLGGHAVWNAVDTLGTTGGVVQVRAQLFPDADNVSGYTTQWVTVTVDPDGDGAAGTDVGPGSVNLLTGDFTVSSQDADEFGMSVGRSASSRSPTDGWVPQGERLSTAQQQVSTDPGAVSFADAGWANTKLGDYTGDGKADVVKWDGGLLYGYVGNGIGWNNPTIVGSGWPQSIWENTRLGDYTGDGKADLVKMEPDGVLYGFVSNGTGWNSPVAVGSGWQAVWQNTRLGDYTGDGKADLVKWENGTLYGYTSYGTSWNSPTVVGSGWPLAVWENTRLGDYTGDGKADLVKMDGGLLHGYAGNGTGWNSPTVVGSDWPQHIWDTTRLGDYTGDGKADLVKKDTGTLYGFPGHGTGWNAAVPVSTAWTFNSNTAMLTRATGRGQGSSTDSLQITPVRADGDTYAVVGSEYTLALGMKPGKRYRATVWIYVPAATGLAPGFGDRGLRVVGFTRVNGTYSEVKSVRAGWVDGWQELTVDLEVPAGATEAFFRLYNGNPGGSGKVVYFDNVSVREVVAPFGPQWRGGAADGVASSGYETLTFPEPDLAKVTLTGGDYLTFGRGISGQFFPEPGAENLTLTKVNDTTYRLSELDGGYTEFTAQGGVFIATSTRTDADSSTSRYIYDITDDRTLLKKVINPVEPGVGDCTTPVPAPGCEVLEYEYATATTATGVGLSQLGDYIDRVTRVKLWSWNPATSTVDSVVVTAYAYDNLGRLRKVWDPRLATPLVTYYEYDSAGRVTVISPPGELPWMFDYGAVGADPDDGRLLRVRRAALRPGTRDEVDGEIATNVVYNVPLTRTAGGPHDMDATSVAQWAQTDVPTDGTALFDPEGPPSTNNATATAPGRDGYSLATVHYLNANGEEINTSTPGGHVDSQTFDEHGNEVWSLESTNRALALGQLPDADAKVAELGLPADSAARAQLLSTVNRYSPDGLDLVDTLGPVTRVVLDEPLAAAGKPTLAAGSEVVARDHTTKTYDEDKPDGATYHLVTTETSGARVEGYSTDADQRTTRYGYSAEKGGTSGWTLKRATSTSNDAGTGYAVWNAAARTVESWDLGAAAGSAGVRRTIYYSATANVDDAACGNKPQWAGWPCVTRAAGAPSGHDPASAPSDLPVKRITDYGRYGKATKIVETAAGKTRTTTVGFDQVGRIAAKQVTSDDGAASIEPITTEYDAATGKVAVSRSGTVSVAKQYDLLGRLLSYTDADGGVTRTDYDRMGKPSRVNDPTGSQSFSYDRAIEPRGLLTSVTDSVAGTFQARYSPDGQLIEVKYPGGITRTDTLDASFNPVGRSYKRDSDGQVVFAESIVENTAGQWVQHTYTGGGKTYRYDRAGRLASTQHVTGGICVTRTYAYDSRANRTSKRLFQPNTSGCRSDGTPDTQENHAYDTADRIVDPGFVHDAFGRVTALPSGLTNSYYANDFVAGQQAGDLRQTWQLDPAERVRSYRLDQFAGGVWSELSIKVNHYGDDTDEPRWIGEGSGSLTRNVSGPDGDLAATTTATGDVRLQLANLHGDVALTIDAGLTTPEFYNYEEFGLPVDAQSDRRYGWLGGKQRSGEALGDVVLMGVRLYSPGLGRFLQTDPEPGGSCNAYDYACADPVNNSDLDGRFCLLGRNKDGGCRGAGAAKAVGNFAATALDNSIVRGIAVGVVVGAACAATAGIGCAIAVGVLAGAALGAANWYVNHRQENPWRHIGMGALHGAVSGLGGYAWGRLALSRVTQPAGRHMWQAARHSVRSRPFRYVGKHRVPTVLRKWKAAKKAYPTGALKSIKRIAKHVWRWGH